MVCLPDSRLPDVLGVKPGCSGWPCPSRKRASAGSNLHVLRRKICMASEQIKQDVIEFKPLNQIVFERLHLEILRNQLKPGDPLRQEEITERMGVSRTPVREA